ncbi:unnamed protein product [Gulo gulo]|uniref:Uncharacterized protein n=1 Tax=Gulo gulo TaxID=48420 RepID=A0A9X9LM58_GULGU|nr:unnamed protein product [Gulo gulo]
MFLIKSLCPGASVMVT